jgi:hypothetical protein
MLNSLPQNNNYTNFSSGTILTLDFGSFLHYGIADGLGCVIHNSKKHKKVTRESYADFAEGKKIAVSAITSANPAQAVVIAKQYLGKPYDLFSSNCEHFARLCHGLKVESTQLQRHTLAALGTGIAIKSDNPVIKATGVAVALTSLLTPTEESPLKNVAIVGIFAACIAALAAA